MPALPAWATWNEEVAERPWTVGVEEEVMLLDPETWQLAFRIDDVLEALPPEIGPSVSAETHGAAIELATAPHATVGDAVAELAGLRTDLASTLTSLDLRPAVAGTHPTAQWMATRIASGARYQAIHDSMRELARREPTFALHIHIAVGHPEVAASVFGRLRAHLPLLLALSSNSPYWQGRDSGLASARTAIFGAFPRTGIPRRPASYAAYVEAIDVLLRCDAFPEPTFLWWDVRLQPALGTIEVRVMDAQTRLEDVAALTALVQCLVRLEAHGGLAAEALVDAPEVLEENRFLASRDGMRARFLDPERGGRRPAREILPELLAACEAHAAALGCTAELAAVETLAAEPGDHRQRLLAGVRQGDAVGPALGVLVAALADDFTARRTQPTALA
jgi:glutamate---cysteine ligase / carboxylate-amine ligase